MKDTILSKVLDHIVKLNDLCYSEIYDNDCFRKKIINATNQLILGLQTPDEAVRNIAFAPSHNACVRVAIDLDLFGIIASCNSISATVLAFRTGAEEELIIRLLRILCGIGFVTETSRSCYSPNPNTKAMTVPSTRASIIHFFDQGLPSVVGLPKYFKDHGYRSPNNHTMGPYQYGHKIDLESYSYWLSQPDVIENFDTFMNGGKLGNQKRWVDWFPTEEVIISGFVDEPDAVMLVDVAGGRGYDIDAFRQKHVQNSGRLILEDLPETIQEVKNLNSSIEMLEYNFFEIQPVKGARAYFVQDIFHNWPTSIARLILHNIVGAMVPGYSKLLISELVLPDTNCPLAMAGLDLGMMYLHSGLERSEQQWRDLLVSEGLCIVQIHHEPTGDGAIIEAIKPVRIADGDQSNMCGYSGMENSATIILHEDQILSTVC